VALGIKSRDIYNVIIFFLTNKKTEKDFAGVKGKREIGSKKEGIYAYFASLFNLGSCDRQKSPQKTGKNFKKIQIER